MKQYITDTDGLEGALQAALAGTLNMLPRVQLTMVYQFVHVIAGQRGKVAADEKYEMRPFTEEDEGNKVLQTTI